MNNIRKILTPLLLGALCLTMVCCINDEPTPVTGSGNRLIGFQSTIDGGTRASEPLSPDYTMWVSALYHHNNEGFFYLKSTEFTHNSADNLWYSTVGSIYPFEGSIDFVGFASKNPAHKPVVTSTPGHGAKGLRDNVFLSKLTLDYTHNNMLDGTDDILISSVVEGVDCDDDDYDLDNVRLNFKHLLCGLRLNFISTTEEASQYIQITGIALNNVSLSGKAVMTRELHGDWTITWPTLTAPTNIKRQCNENPVFGSTDYTHMDFYFPPQDVSNISFTIYYKYRMEQDVYSEEMVFGTGNLNSLVTLEAGRRYNCNIEFLLLPFVEFQISFDGPNGPVVDDWIPEDEITL